METENLLIEKAALGDEDSLNAFDRERIFWEPFTSNWQLKVDLYLKN